MRKLVNVMVLAFALGWVVCASAADGENSRPSIPDEVGDAWDRLQQVLQDWSDRFRERFGARENVENRPAISEMLSRKEALGLSPDQVKKIEQLRDNFERLSIRNNAELRIVELDIAGLLDNPAVDVAKVEAKVREAEKLRADLRIARIKVIEQAKAVLTPEQRKKFYDTVESRSPRAARGQNPSAKE
ncbi:MAG TPA: periplasmic heavy metal sensor [Candidatus Binatia bacterium]|nr:periplasmic heavy metal sensor [Candidatus Binatia bacterium]